MKKISKIQGIVAPLKAANVDTDVIMPKQFLKSIRKTGYGQHLFDAWRYEDLGVLGMDCSKRPLRESFVLNRPEYQQAKILLAEDNFGCGSSREHAVWGILEFGLEAVIAPSFADIFYNNAIKNGLLPVVMEEKHIVELFQFCQNNAGLEMVIDLKPQTLAYAGKTVEFEIDQASKHKLLEGLDDIALTLKFADQIKSYEKNRQTKEPWIFVGV